MYKNSRLGFDIDGPLFPFSTVCFNIINKTHNYSFDEIEFWSRKQRSNRFYGKHRKEIEAIVADPRTYLAVPPTKRQKEVMWKLAKYNEIFYITARSENLRPVTEMWLSDLPNVENLHMGFEYKTYLIRDLCLDFYTDDRFEIIKDVRDNEPDVDSYVYWANYISLDDLVSSGLPYIRDIAELIGR